MFSQNTYTDGLLIDPQSSHRPKADNRKRKKNIKPTQEKATATTSSYFIPQEKYYSRSHGGVSGVRVALVDTVIDETVATQGKWKGISTLNNFSYSNNGKSVIVWRCYNVGKGKTRRYQVRINMILSKVQQPLVTKTKNTSYCPLLC